MPWLRLPEASTVGERRSSSVPGSGTSAWVGWSRPEVGVTELLVGLTVRTCAFDPIVSSVTPNDESFRREPLSWSDTSFIMVISACSVASLIGADEVSGGAITSVSGRIDDLLAERGVLLYVRGVDTSALFADPAASMGVGLAERPEGVGGLLSDICCVANRADLRGDLTLGLAAAPTASIGVGLLRPAELAETLIVQISRYEL